MKINKYSKFKMFLLYVLSVSVNLLPLIIVIAINWGVCTKTVREGVAISVTGIVWVAFLAISMMGAMPRRINRVAGLVIIFVILELMKPLLNYMCLFAGAAAIGAMFDMLFVRPSIKQYLELRVATKTADITTQQVKQAVQEIFNQERAGRV